MITMHAMIHLLCHFQLCGVIDQQHIDTIQQITKKLLLINMFRHDLHIQLDRLQ